MAARPCAAGGKCVREVAAQREVRAGCGWRGWLCLLVVAGAAGRGCATGCVGWFCWRVVAVAAGSAWLLATLRVASQFFAQRVMVLHATSLRIGSKTASKNAKRKNTDIS
ncbi:MAG: hypothetical protein Ta2A_08740 [Treponemataceae bacterium]|nr:MAG: hypothetical protein Ta2A_08740 [Treponemataceae bacterium]